jgi:ABC-type uncharacterized transport system permease subunit
MNGDPRDWSSSKLLGEGLTDALGFFVGALAGALIARVIGFDFLEPGYGTKVLIGLAMVGAGGGIGIQIARRQRARHDTKDDDKP